MRHNLWFLLSTRPSPTTRSTLKIIREPVEPTLGDVGSVSVDRKDPVMGDVLSLGLGQPDPLMGEGSKGSDEPA